MCAQLQISTYNLTIEWPSVLLLVTPLIFFRLLSDSRKTGRRKAAVLSSQLSGKKAFFASYPPLFTAVEPEARRGPSLLTVQHVAGSALVLGRVRECTQERKVAGSSVHPSW